MKLIHLSDIHLTENGRKIWETNTLAHFQKAIQRIKELSGIDGIVISGDLSDDGSLWTYKYIDQAFAEIGPLRFAVQEIMIIYANSIRAINHCSVKLKKRSNFVDGHS